MFLDKCYQHSKKLPGPSFYYDLEAFEARVQSLNCNGVRSWYAMKANPLSSFIKIANQNEFGIDCASLGEVNHALNSGVNPNNIIVTGPAKSKDYLSILIQKGIQNFVVESENQLKWLSELKCSGNVLLRMQKNDWNYNGFNVLGGAKHTQFGLNLEDWKKINPVKFNLNIIGYHIFQWGNIVDPNQLTNIWNEIFSQVSIWEEALSIKANVLDLGGGIGIPYDGEPELDADVINALLYRLKDQYQIPEVWLEPGRYLTGSVGCYIARIVDLKKSKDTNMIILEGGINHLLRPAVAGQAFPCVDFKENREIKHFKVFGPLCTSLDYLGEFNLSSDLKVGDSLAFKMTGAYGFTESMPYFLCHDLPAEVVYYNNNFEILRENLGPESWMR